MSVIIFPRAKHYTFETTTDYAGCINCRVRVVGNRDEGVIAVYAIGIDHVGEDITEHLQTRDRLGDLHDELMLHIAETDQEAAEALGDDR